MPRKKKPTAAARTIDGRSSVTVLEYVAGNPGRDVPRRDLHGGDLARIAYRRAFRAERSARSRAIPPGGSRPRAQRPGQASAAGLLMLAEALVASGRFTWAETIPPAAPAAIEPDPPAPTPAPAEAPAVEPEA